MATETDDRQLAPEKLLLDPLWLGALGVLVVNDHLLKATGLLPAVTGKLSDFAGLLVAPILAATVIRARKRRTAWIGAALVGAVFAAINVSPAAAAMWDGAMATIGVPWHTTTDPTDLVALVMLPVAVHWIPRAVESTPAVGRRRLQWAVATVAGLACLATSRPPDPEPFSVERDARVTLMNKSHELQSFRVSYLASDVAVDCDRVAEAPQEYLREDAFGEQARWVLFSGQQIGLGVEGPGSQPGSESANRGDVPELGPDECRAARVAVETAPDIVVFWDGSLDPKTYQRNSEGEKGSLGGPQTVALQGDYEETADDDMHPFRYRPCEDDEICGREDERQAAAEIPDGAEYRWDDQSGAGLFFEIPDRTERSENDQPEKCRRALERPGIAWEGFPEDSLTVTDVEQGTDGCHELVFSEGPLPEESNDEDLSRRLVCAPFSALRHLKPAEGETLDVSLQQVGRVPTDPDEGRYTGLRIDVGDDMAESSQRRQIWLTRGTRLPESANVEFETRPMSPCGPAETRCGQIELPARLELQFDGETADVTDGEYAVFNDGERREVHVASASERPVVRNVGACDDEPTTAEEILEGTPAPYVEVATVVGFEEDG